jgi:collagenase-like PrtC family protease
LATREDESFLVLNGIQTLSARTCNLLPELEDMRRRGVDVLRISPQARHTDKIVRHFAAAIAGAEPVDAPALARFAPLGVCDGYWRGEAGMAAG